jgi:hypothetical protein
MRRPFGNNALGVKILSMVGFASNWFRSISAFPPSGGCIAVATALRHEWELFSMTAWSLDVVSFAVVQHCPIWP